MEKNEQYQKKVAQEAKKQQIQQYRQSILTQILTSEARERLIKIKMVKPQKVVSIENSLIQLAQSGQLRNPISENQLVKMLERQSETKAESKITFKRRGIDDEF